MPLNVAAMQFQLLKKTVTFTEVGSHYTVYVFIHMTASIQKRRPRLLG